MPDNRLIVLLLKEYAFEASITRPEAGKVMGKTLGQVAGIHNRNQKAIGPWPKIDPVRRKNRRCQFPVGTPGTEGFHLCGCERKNHPFLCEAHKEKVWQPPKK